MSGFSLAMVTSTTFLMGAFCSAFAGYIGMWVSVRANIRVASAARRCYNDAIQICFRAGAVCAILNVALVILGLSSSLIFMRWIFPQVPFRQLPLLKKKQLRISD